MNWKDWLVGVALLLVFVTMVIGMFTAIKVDSTTSNSSQELQYVGAIVVEIRQLQQQRVEEGQIIRKQQMELTQIGLLIERSISASRHPSQVDESILFQLCHKTPGCRIP